MIKLYYSSKTTQEKTFYEIRYTIAEIEFHLTYLGYQRLDVGRSIKFPDYESVKEFIGNTLNCDIVKITIYEKNKSISKIKKIQKNKKGKT